MDDYKSCLDRITFLQLQIEEEERKIFSLLEKDKNHSIIQHDNNSNDPTLNSGDTEDLCSTINRVLNFTQN